MQQIPSGEANTLSAGKDIFHSLWKPKVHCRIYDYVPADYSHCHHQIVVEVRKTKCILGRGLFLK